MGEKRRMNDDLALGYVLGTLDEVDHALAERLAVDDPVFAEAVRRARGDIRRLGRGLQRTAARQRRLARLRRLPWPIILGTAGAALALGLGFWLLVREGNELRTGPVDPVARMEAQVERARIIAVARVTEVIDATPDTIAVVVVEEMLKGEPAEVIAAANSVPTWAATGDRLLLFLGSPRTVLPNLGLNQYRVLDGVRGRYLIVDGELGATAGFTLDDVRART